MTLRRKLRP